MSQSIEEMVRETRQKAARATIELSLAEEAIGSEDVGSSLRSAHRLLTECARLIARLPMMQFANAQARTVPEIDDYGMDDGC